MSEWRKNGKLMKGTDKNLGGTMRLGSYEAKLLKNSLVNKIAINPLKLKRDIDIDTKLILILKKNLRKKE